MFTISVEGDEDAIRKIVSATPFSFVSADYQLWFSLLKGHSLAKNGNYLECSATIPVRYKDKIGGFAPYMYCTCVEAILAGREVFGYPKRPAQMEWIETPQAICASMAAEGKELLLASFVPDQQAKRDEERIGVLEAQTANRLIWKSFPSASGATRELEQVVYRDLARCCAAKRWGKAFVEAKDLDGHMTGKLGMQRILGAKYTVSSYGGDAAVEKREILSVGKGF